MKAGENMERFGKTVVKMRIPILILSILLLIPAVLGYLNTRVNYDVLTYLPDEIETMRGQDILLDEFGTGAISMVVTEGMDMKDVAALKEKIEGVDHVKNVIWYDTVMPLSVPVEILPEKVRDAFINGDATLMAVTYDTGTSDDATMQAITDIRKIAGGQCYLAGISGIATGSGSLATTGSGSIANSGSGETCGSSSTTTSGSSGSTTGSGSVATDVANSGSSSLATGASVSSVSAEAVSAISSGSSITWGAGATGAS